MDTTPPQAPPAISRSEHQETIDCVQRIVDAQEWLLAQQADFPRLPMVLRADGLANVQDQVAAYWSARIDDAPGADRVTRANAFGRRLASVMNDEALLRVFDGSLGAPASELARAFSRSAMHAMPPHVHARELMVGHVAYAGAVIVTDDRNDRLVLLFRPGAGWDEFSSLDTLHAHVEEQLREQLAASSVSPAFLAVDVLPWIGEQIVASRLIEGDAFATLVNRLRQTQQENLLLAWSSVGASPDAGAAHEVLVARAAKTMALPAMLDIPAMLAARDRRLADVLDAERLQGMPEEVQEDWQAAAADYRRLQDDTGSAGQGPDNDAVLSLPAFVHDGLKERLVAKGISTEPEDIVVDVYAPSLSYFYNPSGRVDLTQLGKPRLRQTLTELALRNVGVLDDEILVARENAGDTELALDRVALVAMVREFNAGERYAAYLRAELKTSEQGQRARRAAMRRHAARMAFEAEDARLGYYGASRAGGFLEHHAFRGYRWVRAVIDAPAAANRTKVDGHDVVVRHLTYAGERFRDVLVIGTASASSVSRVVLYTPDAPDGVAFREFDNRLRALDHLMSNAPLRDYLLARLPRQRVTTTANGAERRFRQTESERRANWAFSGSETYGATPADFGEETVTGNVFAAAFDTTLGQLTANVAAVTRTTGHADADNFSPRLDGEILARGIAGLVGRASQASWRAYDQVKAGNPSQAFVDFTDAYVSSLDFLSLGVTRLRTVAPLAIRSSPQSTRLVHARVSLRDALPGFADEYVDHVATLRNADAFHAGVYTIAGSTYVEKAGKVHRVRYDSGMSTWRLCRPDHCGATSAGQPVARDAGGVWSPFRPGLPGGAPPLILQQAQDVSGLTIWQAEVRDQALLGMVRHDVAWEMKTRVARQGLGSLGAEEAAIWDRAYRQGLRAPPERPPVPDASPAGGTASFRAVPVVGMPPAAPAVQILSAADWPDTVWIYPSANAQFPGRTRGVTHYRRSQTVDRHGITGVRAVTTSPEDHARASLRRHRIPFVEVNLRAVRERLARRPWGTPLEVVRTGSVGNGVQGDVFMLQRQGSLSILLEPGDFTQWELFDVNRARNGMTHGQPSYRRNRVFPSMAAGPGS